MQCLHIPKDCSFMLKSGECGNNISVTQTGYGDAAICNRYTKRVMLSKCCEAETVRIMNTTRCKNCGNHINPKDGTVFGLPPRDMALLIAHGPDSDGKGGQPSEGDVESPSPTPETLEGNDKLLEMLATLEHDQWIHWSKSVSENGRITDMIFVRWSELWIPYSELSEDMKERDRIWARKVMKLVWPYIKDNIKWLDYDFDGKPSPPPKPDAIWLDYGTCCKQCVDYKITPRGMEPCLSCKAARSNFRPSGEKPCPPECHYLPDKEDCPLDCNKELPNTPKEVYVCYGCLPSMCVFEKEFVEKAVKDNTMICEDYTGHLLKIKSECQPAAVNEGQARHPPEFAVASNAPPSGTSDAPPADTAGDKGEAWPCGCHREPGSSVWVSCESSAHQMERIRQQNIKETGDKGEKWPCGCVRAPGSPVIARCPRHFEDDTEPESKESKE